MFRRPSRCRLLLFLPLLALACQPAVEAPAEESSDAIVARIEADLQPSLVIEGRSREPQTILERMEHHGVPGVSVAFFADGEIQWTRQYGLAEVSTERPVAADTRFQAASISKPVAATAALSLVDEGLLDLDSDVNQKLTSWSVPANELTAAAPVTLRGLLTHTAGLTVHGFPGYGLDEAVPTTVGVLDGLGNTDPVRVDLEPRTEWRYSGGGYTVMQLLVADVAGQTFPELMRSRVLQPLRMTYSTYQQPLAEELRPVAAVGYRADRSEVDGQYHTYPEMAAAGLWTTPSDLARWAMALQAAHQGEAHPVLAAATITAMLTPDLNGQGLGPGLRAGGKYFGHGGANEGYRCDLMAQLDGTQGFAIMTNSDNGSALIAELRLTIAREYGWEGVEPTVKSVVDLGDEALARYAGSYRAEGVPGDVEIIAEGEALVAVLTWSGERRALLAESATEFFDGEDGSPVLFELDAGGTATGFSLRGLEFSKVE